MVIKNAKILIILTLLNWEAFVFYFSFLFHFIRSVCFFTKMNIKNMFLLINNTKIKSTKLQKQIFNMIIDNIDFIK